jgi:septum formation protein
LLAAGFECEILPVPIDERRLEAEQPVQYVERLARQKAAAAAARAPEAFVLGADTVVVQGNDVLGKPADAENAAAMLRRLSGRAHDVFTGVALAWPGGIVADVDRTRVWMNALTETDIASYLATGEPFDKAGAYGIQGRAGAFVERIEGSYSGVMGLPLYETAELLDAAGVPRWQHPAPPAGTVVAGGAR